MGFSRYAQGEFTPTERLILAAHPKKRRITSNGLVVEDNLIVGGKEDRSAEHKRVRRDVQQELHVATVSGKIDNLALPQEQPKVKKVPLAPDPTPRSVDDPPLRTRHWKQAFWKRRSNERRRKNELLTD